MPEEGQRKPARSEGGGRPQLMLDLGVETWVNLPRPILNHLTSRAFPMKQRVWAAIIIHSYGHEYQNPYCQFRERNGDLRPMLQKDLCRELGIFAPHISHVISDLEREHLLRIEAGKLYPVPKPAPVPITPESEEVTCTCNSPNEESTTCGDLWKTPEERRAWIEREYKRRLAVAVREPRAWRRQELEAAGLARARKIGRPKLQPLAASLLAQDAARLAEIAAAIRPLFPGEHIGEALIGRLAPILAGINLDWFVRRVIERQKRGRIQPGILPSLATESRKVWDDWQADEHRARKSQEHQTLDDIRAAQRLIADPTTPEPERDNWQAWLDRTRRDHPELFNQENAHAQAQ
jgi:hypothetical protein